MNDPRAENTAQSPPPLANTQAELIESDDADQRISTLPHTHISPVNMMDAQVLSCGTTTGCLKTNKQTTPSTTSTNTPRPGLLELPVEMFANVTDFLDRRSLRSLRLVCRESASKIDSPESPSTNKLFRHVACLLYDQRSLETALAIAEHLKFGCQITKVSFSTEQWVFEPHDYYAPLLDGTEDCNWIEKFWPPRIELGEEEELSEGTMKWYKKAYQCLAPVARYTAFAGGRLHKRLLCRLLQQVKARTTIQTIEITDTPCNKHSEAVPSGFRALMQQNSNLQELQSPSSDRPKLLLDICEGDLYVEDELSVTSGPFDLVQEAVEVVGLTAPDFIVNASSWVMPPKHYGGLSVFATAERLELKINPEALQVPGHPDRLMHERFFDLIISEHLPAEARSLRHLKLVISDLKLHVFNGVQSGLAYVLSKRIPNLKHLEIEVEESVGECQWEDGTQARLIGFVARNQGLKTLTIQNMCTCPKHHTDRDAESRDNIKVPQCLRDSLAVANDTLAVTVTDTETLKRVWEAGKSHRLLRDEVVWSPHEQIWKRKQNAIGSL